MLLSQLPQLQQLQASHHLGWREVVQPLLLSGNTGLTKLRLAGISDVRPARWDAGVLAVHAAVGGAAAAAAAQQLQNLQMDELVLQQEEQQLLAQQQQLQQQLQAVGQQLQQLPPAVVQLQQQQQQQLPPEQGMGMHLLAPFTRKALYQLLMTWEFVDAVGTDAAQHAAGCAVAAGALPVAAGAAAGVHMHAAALGCSGAAALAATGKLLANADCAAGVTEAVHVLIGGVAMVCRTAGAVGSAAGASVAAATGMNSIPAAATTPALAGETVAAAAAAAGAAAADGDSNTGDKQQPDLSPDDSDTVTVTIIAATAAACSIAFAGLLPYAAAAAAAASAIAAAAELQRLQQRQARMPSDLYWVSRGRLIEQAATSDAAEAASLRAAAAAMQRLAAAKEQEIRWVVAETARFLGPPLALPTLKCLEVGSVGSYVGCRLADMAPQLTCLRIGCPGKTSAC
jgi:hypothetical protein